MPLVRGDFSKLEQLQRRLKHLTTPSFRQEVSRELAGTSLKLLADEFRLSRDPYGAPWKPVYRNRVRDKRARAKRAAAGRPALADKPLIDTGRLRAAATARGDADGIVVDIPVEYASYHQEGTRHIARRQIVPDDAGGLGPIWDEAFRRTIERHLLAIGSR